VRSTATSDSSRPGIVPVRNSRQKYAQKVFEHQAGQGNTKTADVRSNPLNLNQTTTIPSGKNIQRKWYVIDAAGQTLGRLASHAASVLAGKTSPLYTPYIDMGDHVVVINAEKITVTGMKAGSKLYRRYTGFPGGLREEEYSKLLVRRPEKILEEAIKGMLPKSKLGRQMATKLKVYKGSEHPHHAQQPVALEMHRTGMPAILHSKKPAVA
jgi:large subunit ribosomal protein L13